VPCLVSLYVLSRKGSVLELNPRFLFTKARSIFTHEKYNVPQEWERRQLYYAWAKEVCETLDGADVEGHVLVDLVGKYLVKDGRQRRLEEPVHAVQAILEKLARRRQF